MQPGLLFKIAFWLVIIGIAALLAPNPAWPESVARFVLSLGIALGVAGLALPLVKRKSGKPGKKE